MSESNGQNGDQPDGGSGGKSERTESGRTELQDQRLTMLAVQRGWLKGTRWPTEATQQDLQKLKQERPLTLKERAAEVVFDGFDSSDERIQQIAVKSGVAMEKQNQDDELASSDTGGVTINVGDGGTVGLIQTRQQLLSDDRYLEYLRTAQSDSDAGLVCDAREPGPVEAGEASQAARQGGNGHADGNGRH